jgi:hypothetical protein
VSALEVVLSHDGQRWRARCAGLALEHADLCSLDRLVGAALAPAHAGERVHVRFDVDTLPAWLRQYHDHYCNYTLRVPRTESP